MGHNANLNKYEVRTDLAIELVKEGVNTRKVGDVKVTNIRNQELILR